MASGMPVLISYANYGPWMSKGYIQSYGRRLIDSGAYSEFNSGKKVDLDAYVEWAEQQERVDAYAGLDDISGDWRRSLRNYEKGGFPTWHETDPPELLPDLLGIARSRGMWIGVGLVPPRENKEHIVRGALEQIPPGFHVHGWALRRYRHLARFDSLDSTNWWRDAFKLKTLPETQHLTYAECLEIIVKRYQRETPSEAAPLAEPHLFSEIAAA
jgi:hypothetical protein